MKMVKRLTKANCEKYGIRVAPEYDFTDDGNRFRGFEWNGLPMTQCYADGMCYLTIREDYLKNNFTYKEWNQTEEYILCDEFNGVTEFDMDKLMENLKRVKAKIDEMNAATAEATAEQKEEYKKILKRDIAKAEELMKKVSMIKWWKMPKYDLKWFQDNIETLETRLEEAKKKDVETMSRQIMAYRLEYGYVIDTKYVAEYIEKYIKEYPLINI